MGARRLKIGNVTAIACRSWGATPDDRQELIKCIDGSVYVNDAGLCEAGETYSAEADVTVEDWETIKRYWKTRELVTLQYQQDNFGKCRVLVKGWSSVEELPNFYTVKFEFWRI